MIIEMRIYHCAPGHLPALCKSFEETSFPFWDKHGIRQAGFFTTLIGPSNQTLTYLLKWDSLAERERIWNNFVSDPEWIAVRKATADTSPVIERAETSFLTPTSFSALR